VDHTKFNLQEFFISLKGYITSEYGGKPYPEDTLIPQGDDINYTKNYQYEISDSTMVQHVEIISYYDRAQTRLPKPIVQKINATKSYQLKSTNPNYDEYQAKLRYPYRGRNYYEYDDKDRLIRAGVAEVAYLDSNTIRIKTNMSFSSATPPPLVFIVKTNENGQIIEHHLEKSKNMISHLAPYRMPFVYNKAGELVKKGPPEPTNGQKSELAVTEYVTYSYHR